MYTNNVYLKNPGDIIALSNLSTYLPINNMLRWLPF